MSFSGFPRHPNLPVPADNVPIQLEISSGPVTGNDLIDPILKLRDFVHGQVQMEKNPENLTTRVVSPTDLHTSSPKPVVLQRKTTHGRAYLSEENKLALVRLCIENQADHKEGKKGFFWTMIGQLMAQEENLPLKDPQNTMKTMVAARNVEQKRHKRESGTVQPETDLSQAVDLWIQHEEDLERLKEQSKKPSTQKEKEAKEAATHRSNLLLGLSNKHEISEDPQSSSNSSQDDGKGGSSGKVQQDGEVESEGEVLAVAKIRHLRKKPKTTEKKLAAAAAATTETQMIVTAFESMGTNIAEAMKEMGQGGDLETGQRLDSMETEMRCQASVQEEQMQVQNERAKVQEQSTKENSIVLAKILAFVEQSSRQT